MMLSIVVTVIAISAIVSMEAWLILLGKSAERTEKRRQMNRKQQQQQQEYRRARASWQDMERRALAEERSMKTYNVYVSQQDIDAGIPGSLTHCPISYALERAGLNGVFVPIAELPWRAQAFIRSFDIGQRVVPFGFELRRQAPRPAKFEQLVSR